MAKYFAGCYKYEGDEDEYLFTNKKGYLYRAEIKMTKTLHFKNEKENFEDSVQQYFAFIKKIGGVEKCREQLLLVGYDSILVHKATTNYYADGSYDMFVILDPKNCKIIEKM